jgi:hypothetical protein
MIKSIITIVLVLSVSLLGLVKTAAAQDDQPLMPFAEVVKQYVLNCNLGANFFTKATCHVTITKLHDGDCKSSLSYITIEACDKIDQYLTDNPK